MNGTKAENSKGSLVDGSRFVFDEPALNRGGQPGAEMGGGGGRGPSPEAFMPRPARPFPISQRDENPKRGNWWNKIEFIFACIAVSINPTILSILPYKTLSNGGWIFLIFYALGVLLIVFPYLVLEMALGQFSSAGIISMWNFAPLFKGIGVVATLWLALTNVMYTILASHSLLYAFFTIKHAATTGLLPWLSCDHAWNTPQCEAFPAQNMPSYNATLMPLTTPADRWGSSVQHQPFIYPVKTDPATEYLHSLIGNSEQIDLLDIGGLKPTLVFGLLATWGFILSLTCMGAKWTGKVAYVVLPVLVILLFALLIRGATLPGAVDGLNIFLYPNLRVLFEWRMYFNVLNVVIYGSVMGFGVISSLSSYNKFHNNICLDAFLVVIAVIIVSLITVLLTATFTGFYAHITRMPVGNFVGGGFAHLLQAFPLMLGAIPAASAWSCVFFLTVFLLYSSSSIYMVQALLTTLLDLFHLPHSFIFLLPTTGIICVLSFLISLPMVTEGGIGVIIALDWYALGWAPLVVVIILSLASVWIYGTIPEWNIMRLPKDVGTMFGCFCAPVQVIFLFFWIIVVPLVSLVCLVLRFVDTFNVPSSLNPPWMRYVMMAVGIVPLILIPLCVALYQLCKQRKGYTYFTQMFWQAAKSSPDWGPPLEQHRRQVRYPCSTDAQGTGPPLNSEIHFNPAARPAMSTQLVLGPPQSPEQPQTRGYSPPPPAYNGHHHQQVSPGSSKNQSPAPSSTGSALPGTYPSPFAAGNNSSGGSSILTAQQQPSTPPPPPPPTSPPPATTASATNTLESRPRYPTAPLDIGAGPEIEADPDLDPTLSEIDDSPFINISSHETTL